MIAAETLRNLRATDAEWLHELHALCFPADKVWSAELFAKTLIQPHVSGLLFIHEQQPAGFILLSIVADEAEILTFCVAPHAQRRAIGTRLVRYACNDLQKMNVARVFLEVAVNNSPALALYTALGFAQKGVRKNYYKYGEEFVDALIMERALPLT